MVYVVFLATLGGALFLIVPRMMAEARVLARQYIVTEAEAEGKTTGGVLQREARDLIDGVIVAVAGEPSWREFRESEAYKAVVNRSDAAITTAMPRIIRGNTLFANEAVVFTFQFLLSAALRS